jgi:hypothetical protein
MKATYKTALFTGTVTAVWARNIEILFEIAHQSAQW